MTMRALVLSGGGSRGAYQAGVVSTLSNEHEYDIYAGTSIGAINAGVLACWKHTQDGAHALLNLWSHDVSNRLFKKRGLFGLSALWKPSYWDASGAHKLIRNNITHGRVNDSGKRLRVVAVGLETGILRSFHETDEDIVDGIVASSAFPGAYQPIFVRGELVIDGGVREMTPLGAAIDAGATHVDVVLTSPRAMNIEVSDKKRWTTLDVAIRAIDIMADEIIANDLKLCALTNKLVAHGQAGEKRHINLRVIAPREPLPGSTLDFDPKAIKEMISIGMQSSGSYIEAHYGSPSPFSNA